MIDLDAQIKAAMKAKDAIALNAYRSLKTKAMLKFNEAGRGGKPLSEEELGAAVKREVRERQEANEFLQPGDPKHGENAGIIALLEGLLPKTLSGEALEALVKQTIADSGAQGAKDMGRVMAALKKSGQPLDMAAASARVRALLGA
jgi:uncharacterized protein YqeY